MVVKMNQSEKERTIQYKYMDRQIANRQTDRLTDRQKDRWTNRQI